MFVRMLAGFLQAAAGVSSAVWWRGRHPVDGPRRARRRSSCTALRTTRYFLVATPLGWLALWLFVRGDPARAGGGDGAAVLDTAAWCSAAASRRLRRGKKLPARSGDRADDGFVIDSARDYDWHALTTVELDGVLYAVAREAGTSDDRTVIA